MIRLRKSSERGRFDHGWLDTRHTFSFADYYDPEHMGFRALRVMNEDWIRPGQGFGAHGHRDMEILTCVLEGSLEHRDSLGNGSVLRAGDLQRMTAGTGVRHSEFNPSATEAVHLYQVWLQPARRGLPPSYEEMSCPNGERRGRLRLVASPQGRDGSLTVHQDVDVYLASLDAGQTVRHELRPGRHAWVQVLRGGGGALNGLPLSAGDGAAVSEEAALEIRADGPGEVMLFDLA
jgi:redox-sensitive bicupin YhaK (pirin superfamily)